MRKVPQEFEVLSRMQEDIKEMYMELRNFLEHLIRENAINKQIAFELMTRALLNYRTTKN
jgi:hypothetical protein